MTALQSCPSSSQRASGTTVCLLLDLSCDRYETIWKSAVTVPYLADSAALVKNLASAVGSRHAYPVQHQLWTSQMSTLPMKISNRLDLR